jgi:ectoine hydroxylase
MNLTPMQKQAFHENGYLLIENMFTPAATNRMLDEMYHVIAEDCPKRILEKNGQVRSFFAPEESSVLFNEVIRSPKLMLPASQLIGDKIYVHQSKLNSKFAMVGDWWDWHQDYTFWKKDDGMPAPDVLTAMIFLNEVTEFNGPLLLIPGSHKAGTVDEDENKAAQENDNKWFSEYKNSTTYMTALTADLKYTLKQNTVLRWAQKSGLFSAKGPAGSVLFFHGNIFHASSNNLSPWNRHTFLVTYNSIENKLPDTPNPRPSFIANRNYEALTPLTNSGFNL